MSEYRNYKKTALQPARPYVPGETLPAAVSIGDDAKAKGSPKLGDMIACHLDNPNDQ